MTRLKRQCIEDILQKYINGTKTQRHPLELEALVNATCEGYIFPRNWDKKVGDSAGLQ